MWPHLSLKPEQKESSQPHVRASVPHLARESHDLLHQRRGPAQRYCGSTSRYERRRDDSWCDWQGIRCRGCDCARRAATLQKGALGRQRTTRLGNWGRRFWGRRLGRWSGQRFWCGRWLPNRGGGVGRRWCRRGRWRWLPNRGDGGGRRWGGRGSRGGRRSCWRSSLRDHAAHVNGEAGEHAEHHLRGRPAHEVVANVNAALP